MIKAIEPLGKHDRAAFSCGVAALDDWFPLRAGQDEKRNVARVVVAVDDQRGVVGFSSLRSFTLSIADLPLELAKRLPRYDACPAALIGRLARDQRVRTVRVGAPGVTHSSPRRPLNDYNCARHCHSSTGDN